MSDITLKELNRKKANLENEISDLIFSFMAETGVGVSDVVMGMEEPEKHRGYMSRVAPDEIHIFVDLEWWAV